MKITEKELIRRKKSIVQNALRLFCQRGIDHVTMAEIAASAEVCPASVYRYFNTKVELARCAQKELWEKINDRINRSVANKDFKEADGITQVELLVQEMNKLTGTHADFILFWLDYKLLLVREREKITTDEYLAMSSSMRRHFCAAVEKGHADGTIDSQRSGGQLFGAVWAVVRGNIENRVLSAHIYEGGEPPEVFVELIREMAVRLLRGA